VTPWNYPFMHGCVEVAPPWRLATHGCSSPPTRRPPPHCLRWPRSWPRSSPRASSPSWPATRHWPALVENDIPRLVYVTGSVRAGIEGRARRPERWSPRWRQGAGHRLRRRVTRVDRRPVSPVRDSSRRPGLHGGHTRACRPKVHATSSTLWSSRPGHDGRRTDVETRLAPSTNGTSWPASRASSTGSPSTRASSAGAPRWAERGYSSAHRGGGLADDEMVQSEISAGAHVQQLATSRSVEWANGVEYGLARACGPRPQAGHAPRPDPTSAACGSTRTSRSSPRCHHGASKHSGYGKDLSVLRIEDYTRIKSPEQHRTMSARTTPVEPSAPRQKRAIADDD